MDVDYLDYTEKLPYHEGKGLQDFILAQLAAFLS